MPPTRRSTSIEGGDERINKKAKCSHHTSATATLTLESSDGEIHSIDAYHLQSSSSVFRSMMEAGGECTEKIVLTDRDLETSEVLNIVLPFIADHTTDLEEWTLPCGTQVVEFLKKYDCQRELRLLSLEIYQAIYGPDTPSHGDELFVLAAWLEHWQLCNLITQKYGQWYWRRLYDGDEEDDCFGEVLWKGRMFDPRTWEDEDLAKLPADVMWAFLRASHKVDWNKKDDKEFKAMGREFVRSMGLSPSRTR